MLPILEYDLCGATLGGLRTLFVVPEVQVLSVPDPLGYEITTSIILEAGANMIQLDFPEDGAEFSEDSSESDHGLFYKKKLSVSIPKDSPNLAQWSNTLGKVRNCILVAEDNNGFFKLIGSKEFPMVFASATETGKTGASKSGHTFSWSGESIDKSFFFPAFDIAAAPAPNNSGLPVTIINGLGELVATIQPGGTFQITSGFSYGFRILE